jgi:hypothetical protein
MRRGIEHARVERSSGINMAEVLHLPIEEKRQICADLLEEFGANVVEDRDFELRFHCNLPFGNHAHGDTTGKARLNYEKMTFNCFAGETPVRVFDEGVVPLKELARRGSAVLLDGDGRWVECKINTFPSQRLWRVTVSRNKVVRQFYATANHRWLRKARGRRADGSRVALVEATTEALRPGDRLPSVWKRRVPAWDPSPIGIARGFVYGDGTLGPSSAVAVFCCPKDEPLLPYFASFGEPGRYGEVLKVGRGIPKSWKIEYPALGDGSAYLYGWLAGYFAADGSVTKSGQPVLSSADRGALEFVQVLCDRLGIRYYDIQVQERIGFGQEPSALFQLSFDPASFTEAFFVLPHHRERWVSRSQRFARHGWVVVAVEETERVEEVYCPEVPTTGSFVLDGNLCTKNCWVCGGGGFLWWLQTMRDEDLSEIRNWLAARTGIGGVQDTQKLIDFLDAIMSGSSSVQTQQRVIPNYDVRILDQWAFIHPYLTEFRHIPVQNVIDSRVGYGTLRVRVGDDFVPSERVIIPHFWEGQLVGWQSRRLTDDGTPKYTSTPEMPKDLTLYNYDPTKPRTILVEAPISVVSKRHLAHMEATFGSKVTPHQLDLIARHSGDLVLWMDNDPAGWHATEEMCEYLSQRTSRLFVVDSPYAADPADMDDVDFERCLRDHLVHWSLWHRPVSLLEYRRNDVHQEVLEGRGAP